MMETKETGQREITYEEIEKHFREEAGSLIPEETIEQVLKKERVRFACAKALDLSPAWFTTKNISRYVKGLLRHEQPFPFLYEFLGFMMELSMSLFVYLLLYGAVRTAVTSRYQFFSPKEFLYAGVILFCLLLFNRIKTILYRNFLWKQGCLLCAEYLTGKDRNGEALEEKAEKGKKIPLELSDADKQALQKKILISTVASALVLCLACVVSCILIWRHGLSPRVKLDPVYTFLSYVAFALLSGIHNVIYSSYVIPFFTIGGQVLLRKQKEEIETSVTRYKMFCYNRMLSFRGKTMDDFLQDPSLAENMMQSLRGRMAVYRGTTFVGFFIPLVLFVVCIIQMILLKFHVTAGLLLFTVCSVFGAVIFLLAFLSASAMVKALPKKKGDGK